MRKIEKFSSVTFAVALITAFTFTSSPQSIGAPTPSQPTISAQPGGDDGHEGFEGSEAEGQGERRTFGHDQRKSDPFRHIEEDHEGGIEEIQIALVAVAVILAALLAYRAGRRKGHKNSAE